MLILYSVLSHGPKHILNRHLDELLAYIEPKDDSKQQTLVNTLKGMKDRQTFQEQW